MSHTPRSRTPSRVPSRAGTPGPSRFPPPLVRAAPSVSSLRVYSLASSTLHTPRSISPAEAESSASSSSLMNPDVPEGILISEPDAEVETIGGEQGSALGIMESDAKDENTKRNLREQLRRTLSKKESAGDIAEFRRRRKGKGPDIQEVVHTPANLYPPRQYFVLTDAGKPVFISAEDENNDAVTSTIGIIQALVSIFLDDGDKLRCINAGKTRITFLLRPPLYYVCVSAWGEPESVARFHLEYLHLQILSVVSAEQLRRLFERRNFDLRRLLSGAEPFLYSMLNRLEWDLALSTSSLHCLRLDDTLRKSVADVLIPTAKMKDVLYVVLVAQGRAITLIRPRKHSIHPSDLHILVNTVHSPSIVNSAAAASWLPICLPKYNSAAFVNAYVMFLRRSEGEPSEGAHDGDEEATPTEDVSSSIASITSKDIRPDSASVADSSSSTRDSPSRSAQIGLVCVSGSADFEAVRTWCDSIAQRLERDGLLESLTKAIVRGETEYSVSTLGIPGLRHFMYKSRSHVQLTMPIFEEPYDDLNEKRRLITLYQTLFDAIHAKSGQEHTLKLQYIRTNRESVMGWITQPFELYLCLSPRLPKSAAVGAANSIAKWVQKEEKRLFLRDAPVL